jgi:hypothetical protein
MRIKQTMLYMSMWKSYFSNLADEFSCKNLLYSWLICVRDVSISKSALKIDIHVQLRTFYYTRSGKYVTFARSRETVISIYLWSYPYGNREYFSIYTCRLMLPLFVVWLLGKWAPRRLPKSCLLMVKSRPSKAGIQRLIDMSWILYFIHLDLLKISPHKYMQAGLPITAVPSYIYIIVGNVRVPPGTTYHLQWNF